MLKVTKKYSHITQVFKTQEEHLAKVKDILRTEKWCDSDLEIRNWHYWEKNYVLCKKWRKHLLSN